MSAEIHLQDEDGGDLPASPPPEVLVAVDAAMERVGALEALDRTLRFAVEVDRGLTVEVRTLAGGLVRRVSPAQALSVMGHGQSPPGD